MILSSDITNLKHVLKKLFPTSGSLSRLVHVEIQNTQCEGFVAFSIEIENIELLSAQFQKADDRTIATGKI